LHLACNQLRALPSEISKLTLLQTLALNTNMLKELPVGIGQCSGLTSLIADNNQLCNLPSDFGNLVLLQSAWVTLSTSRLRDSLRPLPG
jgi:Leucine-rich repeat (LRR) protein